MTLHRSIAFSARRSHRARAALAIASVIGVSLSASFASPARAQMPIAPALAGTTAHKIAESELSAITAKIPTESRSLLAGVYVAFDPNPNDASAVAACDDDGDYVVVVTDAMLSVADYLAQAVATDETFRSQKVDDYAAFVASGQTRGGQTRGARFLPPPPGFFDASQSRDPTKLDRERARFRQIVGAIVAHEIAHMTAGDLTCPHPTATRERGDDTWTRAEAQAAFDGAAKIYTAPRVLTADATATALLLDSENEPSVRMTSRSADDAAIAYLALLAFFHEIGDATYARAHHVADIPSTSTPSARIAIVEAAASKWNALHSQNTAISAHESTASSPSSQSTPSSVSAQDARAHPKKR